MSEDLNQENSKNKKNYSSVQIVDEMKTSYLSYAMSVIISRALPDARDGLKPVHRRIIYAMYKGGYDWSKQFRKSARVVGDVIGKYHPHGDTAVYDTIVRMAQDFSLRYMLVDGQGNFGSVDGDNAAAMRYTEIRMSKIAHELLEDIDKETVDFGPNYDGSEQEPLIMPARIPNLLINGSSGIAVGMATNMAPHNLAEVIAAAKHLMENPKATLKQLMKIVPGPDFPTGGHLVATEGIADAYANGRGSFKVRATTVIEKITARKQGIVITELPYNIGPEKIVEKIADLVKAKKIQGISDIVDLSDGQSGTKVVVEIKNGYEPAEVLEHLYRLTPMEDAFSINAVALVNGKPLTLGLKDLLQVFIDHRIEVVKRRSIFRKAKAQGRLNLVDGLLKAIVDIDKVIKLIRGSEDATVAKAGLIKTFKLSDEQATYILDMPLRRLTKMSKIELETEAKELKATIATLTAILKTEESIKAKVSEELSDIEKKYASPRRTRLVA